jgi:hypothetical protein
MLRCRLSDRFEVVGCYLELAPRLLRTSSLSPNRFTSLPGINMTPHQHRLYDLWEDFLQKMDSIWGDNCAGLLDCFITIP